MKKMLTESDSVASELIEQQKEVVGNEPHPRTYRWEVTETIYLKLYDEITPVCRVDGGDDVRYNGEETLIKTAWGAVVVSRCEDGDVSADSDGIAARAFDGDAVLHQYEPKWRQSDVDPADLPDDVGADVR